ncbi:MAG: DNA polymerase (family 10), partial [Myxococcota bacterium]
MSESKPDRNEEVRALLDELAHLTLLDEQNPNAFRVRAYENGARAVRGVPGDILGLTQSELLKIPNIGKAIASKIREYADTDRIDKLERLRAKFPPQVVAMSRVPGLGPKLLTRLRAEANVHSLADLKRAIDAKALRDLKGFGAKTEQNLGRAIQRLGLDGETPRTPIVRAMRVAERLVRAISAIDGVVRVQYCGSLRRFRETVGDLDIVVASTRPEPVMEAIRSRPEVREIIVSGATKTTVVFASGLQIDVRVVAPEQYGAALLYFTGSKAHNIKLRMRAIKRGWTLNEYGLTHVETGSVIASESEEDIYRALDLPFIPAPMREDTGEIEAAELGLLVPVLAPEDVRGDLHCHTDLSGDGRSSLQALLGAAQARFDYIAITEHAENLAANGVSREELLAQRQEMMVLQRAMPDLTLLHGVELNMDADGGLDYDQDFRMSFDWCIAAVHSHFDQDMVAQTRRILAAMSNPAVSVIGHLTGRRIGHRPGIEIDVGAVLEAAAVTGTALEINAALGRLDCPVDVLRRARELDVTMVMSTDAHHVDEFDRMRYGVQHAARGWVDPSTIANTWPKERFLE